MKNSFFPFSAIVGQDNAKNAIIYNLINPRIGGVLLSGEKGTAKSSLIRSISSIDDRIVIDLPLNITEDMLVGSLDFNKTIKLGKKEVEYGVLKKAHTNILYVDEINLMSSNIVNCLLDVSCNKINIIEREGIALKHDSDFILTATMNPEEGSISNEILDRFGLFVDIKGVNEIESRKLIVKRYLEYENNQEKFINNFKKDDQNIYENIRDAKNRLPLIHISEKVLEHAVLLSKKALTKGHRSEIILVETALSIAAIDKRDFVLISDIDKASKYVLPHRKNQLQEKKEKIEDKENERTNNKNKKEQKQQEISNVSTQNENNEKESSKINDIGEDEVVLGEEIYKIDMISQSKFDSLQKKEGSGRRSKCHSGSNKGRYIGSILPKEKINDIAFDATIRKAALNQKKRGRKGGNLVIRTSDIVVKKREKHMGNSIFFLVDASGSMNANKRMKAVKDAILSILYDAYQKRDKVSLIAFRKDSAEVLLPLTKSVNLAQKCLQNLPTGGKTPLAEGLECVYKLIKGYQLKDSDMIPLIVLISDGRANYARDSQNPVSRAIEISKNIYYSKIPAIVIDTENDYISFAIAKKIAKYLNAKYYKIDDLKGKMIKKIITDK